MKSIKEVREKEVRRLLHINEILYETEVINKISWILLWAALMILIGSIMGYLIT